MQTIGERLEEARKRKGISIREASEATKIRSDYLQKFENNTFELNLPDIYVRGFLRTYAQYLKLNSDKLLTDYASLGLGGQRDSRRHHDSREIMGRIDLSDTGRTSTPQSATASVPSASTDSARQSSPSPRSVPTAVVTGAPSADRKQKLGRPIIFIGAGAALIVVILIGRLIFSSSSPAPKRSSESAPSPAPAAPANDATVLRLIALGNVWVKVVQQVDKKVLFEGDLIKGDSRALQRTGKVTISYDNGRFLQVEVKGQRFRMSSEGQGSNTILEATP
jgi:transcriptional regulator with XRE-family HTH domain